MEKISRTKIVDVLKREDFGAMVNVKGWVRTRRGSKQVNFIALNDGSTINNVQVVVDLVNFDEEMLKDITTGACLSVNGELTESVGSGQKAEIQAREIEVLGTCDNTYPLQKKGHTLEFLREIAHLRPRTNTFGAVFRIRHNMAIAIHTFFHQKGFVYFHTPIITASDCEGAGQMFQVTTMNLYDLKKDENGNNLKEIDWEKTRAVATRGGQIYVNLKGKYPTGIVDPADKYELEREIIDGLYNYRLNGKRVIAVAMRNKDAMVLGTGGPECGDVLYWLEEGVNRLHGDALPMVEGVYDTSVTPIFIAAGKGLKKGYQSKRIIRQVDMTPTVAHMLGVRMPKQCEGAVIYQILEDADYVD